uniref:Uncharacterized protein n=1 Tax=Manihot esculenta TaxID=3983 RepID=A0A251LZE0_MANES
MNSVSENVLWSETFKEFGLSLKEMNKKVAPGIESLVHLNIIRIHIYLPDICSSCTEV